MVTNRFDQLFDDESDPFEVLKAAENKKKEAGGGGVGGPGAKSAAQAAAQTNSNAAGKQLRKESQKDRKNPLPPSVGVADKKEETQPPVALKKEGKAGRDGGETGLAGRTGACAAACSRSWRGRGALGAPYGAGSVAAPESTPLAGSAGAFPPRAERARRGRPGRSRRFLPGARLLAQRAREQAGTASCPACSRLPLPAVGSCPAILSHNGGDPQGKARAWSSHLGCVCLGALFKSGGSCCWCPTCAFCVVPFRSRASTYCNSLA